MGKSLFASKTFWLNVFGVALQVLPIIGPLIPQPYGVAFLGVANILIRLVTKEPITSVVIK